MQFQASLRIIYLSRQPGGSRDLPTPAEQLTSNENDRQFLRGAGRSFFMLIISNKRNEFFHH